MLYLFADCALDTDRRELRRGGDLLPVEPQVFDLLEYLIRNRDRVVSKDNLVASIWHGRVVSESALATRINAARSAIGDSGEAQRLIKTLPRKGIRFVGVVRQDRSSSEESLRPNPEAEPGPTLVLPDKPSVAVLPFINMSDDPEQEYFADGVAEEITTALSRCNSLFVIARNSSFTYKGKVTDIRQIGRELGVRYVVEGSVRRSVNRLRLTIQLLDAGTAVHIWAHRFEGEWTEIFDLQDRLAEGVAAIIEPNLQRAEIERMKKKPVSNLDAYDLLLRAQQLEYEYTEQSLDRAIQYLHQAIGIDPNYAAAMAHAGHCYSERVHNGWSQDDAAEISKGLDLAARAFELGRDDGNVLWMVAHASLRLGMDRERASVLVQSSLELNPNSAIAMTIAGLTEVMSGNADKSIELLERAQRLNPRDPRGWLTTSVLSLAYFTKGLYDQAASVARKSSVQNSRFGSPLRVLAASLAVMGDREQAAAAIDNLLKIHPGLSISTMRGRLLYMDEGVWKKFSEGLRLAGMPE